VHPVRLAPQVRRARKDPLVLQELRDQQDLKARPVSRVFKDLPELPALLVLRDRRVLLVFRDQPVNRVFRDRPV
jgi:hypothetical protein